MTLMDGSKLFELHLVESLKFIRKSDLILSSYQKEALKSVLAERDTFVSLPAGHGKSIVFELLPYLCDAFKQYVSPSAVLVISPLISLMESPVSDLRQRE
jgi:superfamily II DNA helicase RecQ